MKKIRKTTITITILSPEDKTFGSYSLHDIAHELDDGDSVGDHAVTSTETVEGREEIIRECQAVGHDGSLFDLDEED